MEHYVRAVVRYPDGRVLDTGYRRVNTLVRNFYALLATQMSQESGVYTATRGDGTTFYTGVDNSNFAANGAEGDDELGIVVGTGTTSPTRLDYALESKITHGTGAGQLYYGACSFDHGDDWVEVRRSFDNYSGADITINEVGLRAKIYDRNASTERRCLIARALYTITVPDGGSVTLYYRISG